MMVCRSMAFGLFVSLSGQTESVVYVAHTPETPFFQLVAPL